jgi:hypothetical protein
VAARIAVPLVLAAIVLGNVPGLGLGRVLDTVGLSQRWSVFAPEPASRRIDFSVRVDFADGGHATWRPPQRVALDAPLGYHWEMWAARVVRDDNSSLWEPAARWIARNEERPGRRVVSVTLRRRWSDVPAPGARQATGPQAFDFFTLDLPRGDTR